MNKAVSVIMETPDFLALNKPAGLLVHSAPVSKKRKIEPEETLVDWLVKNYPEIKNVGDNPQTRPGIVHRLDKETSGVIVVAKNQRFFDYLKNAFQNHLVKKAYLALVYGHPQEKGVINKPIGLKPGTVKRTVHITKNTKMIKEAITEYRVKNFLEINGEKFALIELFPKTGRTHQLRVHLASIGHPIVGDALYGPKKNPLGVSRQFLHAESIEFSSEDGKRVKFEAELPDEMTALAQTK